MVINPVVFLVFGVIFIFFVIYGIHEGLKTSSIFSPRGLGVEPNSEIYLPVVLKYQADTLEIVLSLIPKEF